MIGILQFRPTEDGSSFRDRGQAVLAALAERAGFIRGSLGRSTDDEDAWVLLTEWESVGAYRRGLGGYDVRLLLTPLMAQALDQPSAFEQLVWAGPEGIQEVRDSDRAPDER
ncbi:MAG: hypothetical protein QOK10_2040 [Pseudonocardiales bacterium]|jgi:hypothetical protein|nr:hypothetical protein [Pseudonocardiales bacterium]